MNTILLDAQDPKTPTFAADLIRRGRLVAIPHRDRLWPGRRRAEPGGRGQNF